MALLNTILLRAPLVNISYISQVPGGHLSPHLHRVGAAPVQELCKSKLADYAPHTANLMYRLMKAVVRNILWRQAQPAFSPTANTSLPALPSSKRSVLHGSGVHC